MEALAFAHLDPDAKALCEQLHQQLLDESRHGSTRSLFNILRHLTLMTQQNLETLIDLYNNRPDDADPAAHECEAPSQPGMPEQLPAVKGPEKTGSTTINDYCKTYLVDDTIFQEVLVKLRSDVLTSCPECQHEFACGCIQEFDRMRNLNKAECCICKLPQSSMVLMPCGHGLCEQDFKSMWLSAHGITVSNNSEPADSQAFPSGNNRCTQGLILQANPYLGKGTELYDLGIGQTSEIAFLKKIMKFTVNQGTCINDIDSQLHAVKPAYVHFTSHGDMNNNVALHDTGGGILATWEPSSKVSGILHSYLQSSDYFESDSRLLLVHLEWCHSKDVAEKVANECSVCCVGWGHVPQYQATLYTKVLFASIGHKLQEQSGPATREALQEIHHETLALCRNIYTGIPPHEAGQQIWTDPAFFGGAILSDHSQ